MTIFLYGQPDHAAPTDVIVVLGGGVQKDGAPSEAQARRVQHAATLYKRGLAPVILCSGGYDTPEHVKSEAAVCSELLQQAGVPTSAILLEELSQSTQENALRAKQVMMAHHLKTALLVTDDFHLLRSKLLFLEQGISVVTSPAQSTTGPLSLSWAAWGSCREVAAFGWYTVQHLLRLPYTDTPW